MHLLTLKKRGAECIHRVHIWLAFLQFSSKLLNLFLVKAEINRHFLKWLPKAVIRWKKNLISQIFHQKKIQKVLTKIDEIVYVFLHSTNFAQHAFFFSLVLPSSYTCSLKVLTKVSKVDWSSQLSYKILWSSFERDFRKDKLHFSQKNHSWKPVFFRVKDAKVISLCFKGTSFSKNQKLCIQKEQFFFSKRQVLILGSFILKKVNIFIFSKLLWLQIYLYDKKLNMNSYRFLLCKVPSILNLRLYLILIWKSVKKLQDSQDAIHL